MSNIQKIPTGQKGWRWKVEQVNRNKIKAELQRCVGWLHWITIRVCYFETDMIKRPYKINDVTKTEYWFKPDLDLTARLQSRWKQFCKTHKV